jgi:hypothetical protein
MGLTKKPSDNRQLRTLIIDKINIERPETVQKLITLVRQETRLLENQIMNAIIELEGKTLRFRNQPLSNLKSKLPTASFATFKWYAIILHLDIATALAVFNIPEDFYPIVFVRYTFGLIFTFFLLGFTLTMFLFPNEYSKKSTSKNAFSIDRVALSVGLSIVFVIMIGLLSYHAPWGIALTSIVTILVILTEAFATVALFREATNAQLVRPEGARYKIVC